MSNINIPDDLKKIAMAGIGAVTVAAEKGREAVETLSKRGEEALAQGRVMNEQLKHDVKEAIKENVTVVTEKLDKETILASLEALAPDALGEIKQKIEALLSKEAPKESEDEHKG